MKIHKNKIALLSSTLGVSTVALGSGLSLIVPNQNTNDLINNNTQVSQRFTNVLHETENVAHCTAINYGRRTLAGVVVLTRTVDKTIDFKQKLKKIYLNNTNHSAGSKIFHEINQVQDSLSNNEISGIYNSNGFYHPDMNGTLNNSNPN
jgi:hypothetical protein